MLLWLWMILLAAAASPAEERVETGPLRQVLQRLDVRIAPEDLPPAPIPGFLEIARGTQILYVSTDGGMLIDGEILSIRTETNLTEQRRAVLRRKKLETIAPANRLVVSATAPVRARLVVFTDTNCPYCLKLHRQREALGRQGIEIHYLFYPRSGPGSASWSQAASVWCSADRLEALGSALEGRLETKADCPNPVRAHYELARQLDLEGTPAILTPDGALRYGITDVADILGAVRKPFD